MDIYFAIVGGRPAFLASGLHEIPAGAVPLSAQEHAALIAGQSAGQEIVAGEDGRPTLRAPASPPLTEADYQRAIEAHVDAAARSRSYSSATSCASYVASTVPAWKAEAEAFVSWRDAVYLAAFSALEEVQGGAPAPTIQDFIAALPAIVWPA